MENFPQCFYTEKEFETWVSLAEQDRSGLESPRFSFCHYCTTDYQSEMIKRGRCQFPDLDVEQFNIDDDVYQLDLPIEVNNGRS